MTSGLFLVLATPELCYLSAGTTASVFSRGVGGELLKELADDALVGADRDQFGLGYSPAPVERDKLGQRRNLPCTGAYALYVRGFTCLD